MHFCLVLPFAAYLFPGMQAPLREGILSVLFPVVPLASGPGSVTAGPIALSKLCVRGAFALYDPAVAAQLQADCSPCAPEATVPREKGKSEALQPEAGRAAPAPVLPGLPEASHRPALQPEFCRGRGRCVWGETWGLRPPGPV